MKTKKPYPVLGSMLTALRESSNLKTQEEFAKRLNKTQQTVSRWESGASRPRINEIPAIASILQTEQGPLLQAAGYQPNEIESIATFDQPFPIELLTPDSFERFCFFLLAKLHPSAEVHRAGGQGHKQDGLDIEVTFSNGDVFTYQCKREKYFGAKKAANAVTLHTKPATKKFVVLSRVASPQLRTEVRRHKDWDIWDKEDVSRLIRSLPKQVQLELVDIFFRGQRLALLGETEPGPWLTSEEFFQPFLGANAALNHKWALIGRQAELARISASIRNPEVVVTFVTGPGGVGKSRLVYAALVDYGANHPSVLVRLPCATEQVTRKSLLDLGQGDKLLIVDDAHDRDDLPVLFQFAADPKNHTRLLLSLRPYGVDSLTRQANAVNLSGPYIQKIDLNPLTKDEATALASQVLEASGGPLSLAMRIAELTFDCTLATVIAAQVVAKEKRNPEFLQNEGVFRKTLLDRFTKVVSGEIAAGTDKERVSSILRVLALIQPFSPDDKKVADLIFKLESVKVPDSNRLIKFLTSSGLLLKRGGTYRISPDVLADHVIENACITESGLSTGYAEAAFDQAPEGYYESIFINLGRLDWRRSNGQPNNSRLLDGMWDKLNPHADPSDTHLKVMASVAYYQPDRALRFAENAILQGKLFRELSDLLKHAAYTLELVPRVAACLWEIGKQDKRARNSHPEHAMRVLADLCSITPGKPVEYCEPVVNFAIGLLDQPDAWNSEHTPYSILEGILRTEGHETTSDGRSFTMRPYLVRQEAVAKLRRLVIDQAIMRLDAPDTQVAINSAIFLHNALRYPMGAFNTQVSSEDYATWTTEFSETLSRILQKQRASPFDSLTSVELFKSIGWHTRHSEPEISRISKQILDEMPTSLEFRTIRAMVDGYGHLMQFSDYETRQKEWDLILKSLVTDLVEATNTSAALHSYCVSLMEHINKFKLTRGACPEVLYSQLLNSVPALAKETLDAVINTPDIPTSRFVPSALPIIYTNDMASGLAYARALLATGNQLARSSVGKALYWILDATNYGPEEIALLRNLLRSTEYFDVANSINAIRAISKKDLKLAIELILEVNIGSSAELVDDALCIVGADIFQTTDLIHSEFVDAMLKKLSPLPALEGHWIEKFFAFASKSYPRQTASFFMRRVEFASKSDNYSFRPCNYGPYSHVPMEFHNSSEYPWLLREVWSWMQSQPTGTHVFQHHASHFFEMALPVFQDSVLQFLRDRIKGTQQDISLIGKVLSNADHEFCFNHVAFVNEFLTAARTHGHEAFESATSHLYRTIYSGVRTSTPGEPSERDVDAKRNAESILETISPASASYRLYSLIRDYAQGQIERAARDKEALENW